MRAIRLMPVSPATPAPAAWPVLHEGDGGREVHALQVALQKAGYYPGGEPAAWAAGAVGSAAQAGQQSAGCCSRRSLMLNCLLARLRCPAEDDMRWWSFGDGTLAALKTFQVWRLCRAACSCRLYLVGQGKGCSRTHAAPRALLLPAPSA